MLHRINGISKRILTAMLIIFIISTSMLNINKVNADSYRYTYDGKNMNTSTYPGYKNLIDTLKSKHSNWNFTIMETGLDFEQVILAETGNKSLIQGKSGSWVTDSYDSSWDIASPSTVKYYMDPRNWIQDNSSLFQFMALGTYVDVSDSELYNAVSDTAYLHDMSIVSQINKACRENSMNPFYVIARIMQEQGSRSRPSSTFAMNDGGVTYYNIFNIGASGKGSQQVIANALQTAKNNNWTSVSSCISGGINTLKTYINRRQDTLYLNKFDVESYNGLYSYQYMQNIMAPQTEAGKMYNLMSKAGLLNKNITFVIPVYTGMKSTKYLSPDVVGDLGPIDIQIKAGHTNVAIRESASTNSAKKKMVNGGFKMLSIKREEIDGWHEIMYNNGNGYEIGYIKFNPKYLEQIADQTNCSETMIIGDDNITLYAGPGKEEMKTLTRGQTVTRIDNTGNYTINGTIWDRISLSDGTQGFVKRENLLNSSEVQLMYVNTQSDPLTIRDAPNGNKIRKLEKGTQVTRISTASDMVGGHYWDEIVTPDGAIGYAAREYLAFVNSNNTANNSFKEITFNNSVEIKIEPNTTLDELKAKYGDTASIISNDVKKKVEGTLGTGDQLKVGDKTYIIIKIGDVNGDGAIRATDYVKIRNYIMNTGDLTDVQKQAADVKCDGKIRATDYVKIRNYIMGTGKINL